MNFYKNHFGMIISSVVAICISLIMATSAIFVDKLTFTLLLLIKNWGTAFLVISLTGMAFPLTDWSFALGRKMGLRPETLPHVLVENFVATLFFNTTATIVLTAVNVFHNPEIEAAVAAGFLRRQLARPAVDINAQPGALRPHLCRACFTTGPSCLSSAMYSPFS